MNTQRATNKNVPTANFFETDFNNNNKENHSNYEMIRERFKHLI